MNRLGGLLLTGLLLAGCSSEGTLGILTRAAEDPGQLMRSGRAFEVLGFGEGEACKRYFLGMIPWGDASLAIAVDRALYDKRGDALINVTVESSLMFSPPPYFLYTVACNTVKGTMIKFRE
jgi:hypothetical protein